MKSNQKPWYALFILMSGVISLAWILWLSASAHELGLVETFVVLTAGLLLGGVHKLLVQRVKTAAIRVRTKSRP